MGLTDLQVNVTYEAWNKGWAVDYNHTYGLVKRGIDTKRKAVKLAKSEAATRARSEKETVDVVIFDKKGGGSKKVTKNP